LEIFSFYQPAPFKRWLQTTVMKQTNSTLLLSDNGYKIFCEIRDQMKGDDDGIFLVDKGYLSIPEARSVVHSLRNDGHHSGWIPGGFYVCIWWMPDS
jgi:hypothetical protein